MARRAARAPLHAAVLLLCVDQCRGLFNPMAPREAKIKLGQSDFFTSVPLGLGTWSWGNKVIWGYDESQDEAIKATWTAAVDAGISFFDTGDSYGTGALEGRAEELLGECRAERSGAKLVYGTKLAVYPWRLTGDSFVDALRASLGRLRCDRVELAQAHWSPANYLPWQTDALLDGLCRAHEEGLCGAVGLSNFGPEALYKAAKVFESRGVPIALNQFQFSLLSTEPEQTGLLDACRELRITPVAYSPLALGALAGTQQVSRTRQFLFDQVQPGAVELTRTIDEVAHLRRKTPAQVCLNWAICKGAVPIVGARSPDRVRENVGALGWRCTAAEVSALDAAAAKVQNKATQNIFMTK